MVTLDGDYYSAVSKESVREGDCIEYRVPSACVKHISRVAHVNIGRKYKYVMVCPSAASKRTKNKKVCLPDITAVWRKCEDYHPVSNWVEIRPGVFQRDVGCLDAD